MNTGFVSLSHAISHIFASFDHSSIGDISPHAQQKKILKKPIS